MNKLDEKDRHFDFYNSIEKKREEKKKAQEEFNN
jgi:hypothetical protein